MGFNNGSNGNISENSSDYFSNLSCQQKATRFLFLAGTAIFLSAGGVANAADLPGVFTGSAAAATAQNADIGAQLGTSAAEVCPCAGTGGKVISDSTGAINAGPLNSALSSNGTDSSIYTKKTATTAEEKNQSEVENLNLLGGMITADAVKSVAALSATKSKVTLSAGDSGFTNLKIAGKSYPGTAKPNTVITLPNIGTVTLNSQTKTHAFTASSIDVSMLILKITNPAGVGLPISLPIPTVRLPVGTTIQIGRAVAGFNRQVPKAALSGSAYGTLATAQVTGALENKIGKVALLSLGCEGTDGALVSRRQSTNLQNIAVVNKAISTAQSGPKGAGMYATTTSTIQSLNLLGGLIKGTNMTAVAKETLVNGKLTSSAAGSGFDQLTILGVPVPTNAPPNTGRALPGLGKVIVNEQVVGTKPGQATTVNGLHIQITQSNPLKIPVGVNLVIAHADVKVAPPSP
jgi:hypothetical protein